MNKANILYSKTHLHAYTYKTYKDTHTKDRSQNVYYDNYQVVGK